MARLISKATGNFTAAGTWGVVDDTSYLDSEAGNTASTTSYVRSSAFTPGAITVDGVAVKIADLAAGGGTVSVELWNDTGSVQVAEVTINVSDIADTSSLAAYNRGWYFFKFGSSQLLLAATNYKIGFKTSVTGTVFLYRDATAGNWSRMLRTTTTAAPASGDQLHVIGEWTAAATLASFTVTMDNTATTSFGPTVSGGPPQGITIGKGGTLQFGTSASTNYYLKWKGVLLVADGGTLNVGTSGTRMPSTSTAVLEMDSVATVDTGIEISHGATVNMYGAEFTNPWSYLNTDEAAAATVLGIASTTGWAANDRVCIASTTRTPGECEDRVISTVDSSTQITVTSGLTYAHSGTSPTQAEVGNLTRNVKVRGIGTNAPSTTTTLQGYVNVLAAAVVTLRSVEFRYLGSATTSKRGIDIATTTGTFDMQYCTISDGWIASSSGFVSLGSTGSYTFSNNIIYNTNSWNFSNTTSSGAPTISGNLMMRSVATNAGNASISTPGGTFTNNALVGAGTSTAQTPALAITCTNVSFLRPLGTFSGNVVHSSGSTGLIVVGATGTLTSFTIWRCNGRGIVFTNAAFSTANILFDSFTLFGNNTSNVGLDTATNTHSSSPINCTFKTCTFNGDTTFSTTNGLAAYTNGAGCVGCDIKFIDCDFSTVSGIKTAHTNDINVSGLNGYSGYFRITLINTKLGAATEVANQTQMYEPSAIGSQKHDQTNGNHKTWRRTGTITIDTTIYDTSPSMRMTPNNASEKLESRGVNGYFRVPIASGATITPSVKVRESVVGDGTDYNGNRPRLIVKANPALGWASDVVLDTATVASEGAWETLTGTTATAGDDGVAELCVDCDGTTGWINVDTWSIA